jgi:hypothetical protein
VNLAICRVPFQENVMNATLAIPVSPLGGGLIRLMIATLAAGLIMASCATTDETTTKSTGEYTGEYRGAYDPDKYDKGDGDRFYGDKRHRRHTIY